MLCRVRGGASSGRLPAEFLTCHSNLPELLLLLFRFALVCVWSASVASVLSRTVSSVPKLFGYPDVHSRLQVTGTKEDFVLRVFHIWIPGVVYTWLS